MDVSELAGIANPHTVGRSEIRSENDVVGARQKARRFAELAGFQHRDQTRLATAVSELARNAFAYGGSGVVEFLLELDVSPQMCWCRVADKGPGIENVEDVLAGNLRSEPRPGLGLARVRRLVERFEIASKAGKGTVVLIGLSLPPRARRIDCDKLGVVARALGDEIRSDRLAVLRDQNHELMQALDEIRRKEEETRQLAAELSDTNRGVVALYAELDERAEQLRKASESKTRFLSNMSHEFRTPLNSVLALSRLLLDRIDGELTPEQERQITYIRRAAEGLLEMVNDLLDLAKVEAGKAEVALHAFSVSDLFGGLRGALKPLLATRQVDLVFETPADLPEIVSDEAKVTQILRNLISNALKFTERGEVRVGARARPEKSAVDFWVKDTGIGIAKANQERIFEEFAQIDSSLQRKVKGTGLGLSLSRSLANALGGSLAVESDLGNGATFTLTLPIAAGDSVRAPVEPQEAKRKVLLIDDDETFRYVMRQIITSNAGYRMLEARDGIEGMELAKTERPDVIIVDLQMPNMDGFSVLQELAIDPSTSLTPVIVSTSLTVNSELKARMPPGTRVISKNTISRETVGLFLAEIFRESR
jgi:signal transduction histidine kinase/CheY-like chemotaxis protein